MLKYLRQQNSNDEKGTTLIEAAIVLPFVLFFLFVSIDLFIFAYQAVAVQYVSTDVMRDVTTSNRASVSNAYGIAIARASSLLLKFDNPEASLCLCQITAQMNVPAKCSLEEDRRNSGDDFCATSTKNPVSTPVPPGESFFLVIRYPVPQLFTALMQRVIWVEAVSIGRVEPRGVS